MTFCEVLKKSNNKTTVLTLEETEHLQAVEMLAVLNIFDAVDRREAEQIFKVNEVTRSHFRAQKQLQEIN
ncbi:hypothetical protein AB4525_00650 [Vibrio breoganii]